MPASRREFLTGEAVLKAGREAAVRAATGERAEPAVRAQPVAGDTIRLETRAMACSWAVILNPGPHDQVMAASDALSEVHRIESVLSTYRETSEVTWLNQVAHAAPEAVTPELFNLLLQCRRLWEKTGGAFDPASQKLITLWSSSRKSGQVPSQAEIDAALARCGMDRVRLSDENGTLTVAFAAEGLGLNFGAIGKGYAIDRAAGVLANAGLRDFLVHGGHSSLFAAGEHLGQGGWPVGLKNPLFTESSYLTLLVRDRALATSGSNIQFFRHGGKRYGHILDPRTGWPADSLLSVSVLAPTAAEADAISTAMYVLGLEKSLAWCDNHPSVGAILTPPPDRGRTLQPVLRNVDPAIVFAASADVELVSQ